MGGGRELEEGIMQPKCGGYELPPADIYDPVVEAFKKDLDRTLLIENLRLSTQQRSEKFVDFMRFVFEMRRAGERLRSKKG
jgi:hypothetical protein